uniref:TGc domain-containing protein n=1 Tax=Macrostomum lignano TaxID=282301 RepID=A0A1I8H9Q4_9PLAT
MGCGASAAQPPPSAPPEAAQTLQSLAAYIESAASTDMEKVRAVYMWITGNITIFGVASKQITGFAKDFGYSPLKALTVDTRVNHDWLAVRVDGKWGFIDCLLGSGCFSDSGVFQRRRTDFYFLPAPEVFLNDHFPLLNSNPEASKPWQLMKDPIDLKTFHSRVRRREACYRLGVQLRSHSSALIDSSGQMKLRFWAAQNPLSHFGAAFFNVPQQPGGRCAGLALQEAVVLARVPTSGTYWELRLFAAIELTSAEDAHLEWLTSFYLKSSGPVDKEPFPDFDGFYGAKLDPHIFGFKKEFGSSDGFCIEVDGGECSLRFPTYMPVRVSPTLQFAKALDQQSSSCSVEMDYLMLTVRIRMSRAGFYRLTLNCKDIYSVSSAYTEFANFLIRCKKPLPKLVAFPRLWHHRHLVKLVSHTEESIQVDTEAVLKFKGTGKPLKQFIARFVHPRTGQRVSGQHIAAVLDYRRNEATVTARPPTSGTFWELQVFASTDDEASASDVIASYQILARQTSSASPFPDFSGFYGLCSSPRKFGFSANFGDSQEFWLKTAVGEFELRLPTLGTVRAMAVLKPALKDRTEQQLC